MIAATCPCGAGIAGRAYRDWLYMRDHPEQARRQGRAPATEAPLCKACNLARPEVVASIETRARIDRMRAEAAADRWPYVRRVVDDVRTWRDWIDADETDPDGVGLEEAERALRVSIDLLAAHDARRIRENKP